MGELADREFNPPRGGGSDPVKGAELQSLHTALGNEWQVIDEHHLQKEFGFPDFQSALEFTNRVGELAETLDHHPDIHLSWGKAKVTIWTHSISGLSEADFVFAARVQKLAA
jgi:4a-hydroxytetrahydrobiopterin dehydratase